PPEDAEVPIGRLDRPVAREVRPVAPVLAFFVPAVLRIVDLHEPLRLAPDRLEDAGPGVPDADVAGAAASGLHHPAPFVVDYWIDSADSRTATARLHGLQRR